MANQAQISMNDDDRAATGTADYAFRLRSLSYGGRVSSNLPYAVISNVLKQKDLHRRYQNFDSPRVRSRA